MTILLTTHLPSPSVARVGDESKRRANQAVGRLVWAALAAALGCADGGEGAGVGEVAGVGRLRLALEADECAAHCVDFITAEVFREAESIPIGSPIFAPCGDEVVFDGLPAGHRVRIRVALSQRGAVILDGWSDPTTVVANEDTQVPVALTVLIPPVITAITPDPAPIGSTHLTVVGSGFGVGSGDSEIRIEESIAPTLAWAPSAIEVDVSASLDGPLAVVRACGVSSEAVTLRILDAAPASVEVPLAICAGARLAGVAVDAERVTVAVACDQGGRIAHVDAAAACAVAVSPFVLDAAPIAVEALPGSDVVALDDGTLHRVTKQGTAVIPWPHPTAGVRRLALSSDGAIVGMGPAGVGVRGGSFGEEGFFESLVDAVDVGALPGKVAILLGGISPTFRLLREGLAAVDVHLDGGGAALGLAVAADLPESFVVACANRVFWVDAASLGSHSFPLAAVGHPAVARGVAFVPSATGLAVATALGLVDTISSSSSSEVGLAAALGDGRLCFIGQGALRVVAPYRGLRPCGGP